MPHYLARKSNEQKGGTGAKKLGGGVKKRAAKETDSSSDNDRESNMSVKPRNKSRVATAGRKSGGLRGAKVAKVTKSGTGVGAVKEKKALDYGSDDFSSSSGDNLTLKATMGKHSIKGLCVCVMLEYRKEQAGRHTKNYRVLCLVTAPPNFLNAWDFGSTRNI